ncbi:hypothetical protein DBV15_10531 [Temnothorax longispinosus]|uniref:Uncharacterized protein n=1 Tax=Temnothorax longispinosus TaxID=300112 RepID=A0A4S2K039_9HYME|nr:hypothetical protein DBV15_10531 [Temnothorax longispinosus]
MRPVHLNIEQGAESAPVESRRLARKCDFINYDLHGGCKVFHRRRATTNTDNYRGRWISIAGTPMIYRGVRNQRGQDTRVTLGITRHGNESKAKRESRQMDRECAGFPRRSKGGIRSARRESSLPAGTRGRAASRRGPRRNPPGTRRIATLLPSVYRVKGCYYVYLTTGLAGLADSPPSELAIARTDRNYPFRRDAIADREIVRINARPTTNGLCDTPSRSITAFPRSNSSCDADNYETALSRGSISRLFPLAIFRRVEPSTEHSRQPSVFIAFARRGISRTEGTETEKWMSVDRQHRNSINVRIGDFAPVFWIAARIKRLTLLDHVASWRSPEGGRAYWRTSRIIVGGTETARARQKRSEKERKTAERSARGRRGERKKERERESCRARKEGTRGVRRRERARREDGQEDEEGTKYRRRTAVGIKRGDGRRCGGLDRAAPLWRPSCPPTSFFLPSSCSFFLLISVPRVRVCVSAIAWCACTFLASSYIGLPYILLPHLLAFLALARASVSGNGERARPLVAPDDAATRRDAPRRAARPRTMLDRIIMAGPLCLRPCHNGTQNARHSAPECAELNVPRPPADLRARKPLLASYDLLRDPASNRQHLIPFIPAYAHVRIQPVANVNEVAPCVVKLAWKQIAITRPSHRLAAALHSIPRLLLVCHSTYPSVLVIYESSIWKYTEFIDMHTVASIPSRRARIERIFLRVPHACRRFMHACTLASFLFWLFAPWHRARYKDMTDGGRLIGFFPRAEYARLKDRQVIKTASLFLSFSYRKPFYSVMLRNCLKRGILEIAGAIHVRERVRDLAQRERLPILAHLLDGREKKKPQRRNSSGCTSDTRNLSSGSAKVRGTRPELMEHDEVLAILAAANKNWLVDFALSSSTLRHRGKRSSIQSAGARAGEIGRPMVDFTSRRKEQRERNDCGVASWNGMRDVQETDEGQTKETRGPRLIHSRFHERERETVFTSVHRHYGNLARIRNAGPPKRVWKTELKKFRCRATRAFSKPILAVPAGIRGYIVPSTAGVNRPLVTYTGTPTGRALEICQINNPRKAHMRACPVRARVRARRCDVISSKTLLLYLNHLRRRINIDYAAAALERCTARSTIAIVVTAATGTCTWDRIIFARARPIDGKHGDQRRVKSSRENIIISRRDPRYGKNRIGLRRRTEPPRDKGTECLSAWEQRHKFPRAGKLRNHEKYSCL